MNKRCVVIFGQFGVAADPVNLPTFRNRLNAAGFETILIEHTDSQRAYNFLHGYSGFKGLVGASLGAGAAPIDAGYIHEPVDFVGGFQPSDWDPVMYTDPETGLRTVNVPANVKQALCFRNPDPVMTGGLGHAIYKATASTKLTVIGRPDIHPGDFGEAQDIMVTTITELAREGTGT